MTDELRGVNPETGMTEDIEEARRVGLLLVDMLKQILDSPLLRLNVPLGFYMDVAGVLVTVESLLKRLSQAQYIRELALMVYGYVPLEVEQEIQVRGYSETLPTTHPDAPRPPLDELANVDPELVKQSRLLSEVVKQAQQERAARRDRQAPGAASPPGSDASSGGVGLSPEVESFLLGLSEKLKREGGGEEKPGLNN
jgi:hypothetical protein